ncbi:hypothetical protein CKQ79_28740, partial [Klebsiella pneumoniae]
SRKQNFGMVSNSFMRVVNNDNGSEIARFDLSEDSIRVITVPVKATVTMSRSKLI